MNANFEKYAREQISGYETAIDADALWTNIQPHVAKDNGNRKILWFFLLGLVAGLAGFGVFYLGNNNPGTTTDSSVIVSEEQQDAKNDIESGLTTNEAIEKEIIATANNTVATVAKTDEVKEKTTKEAFINRSSPKTQSTASVQSTSTKSASNSSGSSLTFKNTDSQDITPVNSGVDMAEEINRENAMVDPPAIVSNRNLQATATIAGLYPKALTFDLPKEYMIPADLMKGYEEALEDYKEMLKNKKTSRRRTNIFSNLKYGVGLYTGIGKSTPNLDTKSESADAFLLARTNSEKQLETLNFGLNFLIETEQNVYIRTGVEYTRIASLFSRESEQVTSDTTQGVVEYQINALTGDTTEIIGDVVTVRKTKFNKKSYNYYHLVDVPVIVGYNFGSYPWRIGVEAGIYANVYIKNKGDIGLADETFYDIGEDENSWYKTNIGISPFIGVNAAYNVSENIQIHMSPGFRFNSVFTTDDSPIKERHANLGVQAGIRYFFD